jgi:hypothetical protein
LVQVRFWISGGAVRAMENEKEPRSIKTTRQLAALRQIHGAIEHLLKGELECATTLALAAECQLPPTDSDIHLLNTLRKEAPDLASDGTFNLYRNWLKHWDEDKPDEIEMSELLVAVDVMRAISKFYALYGKASDKMQEFWKWSVDKEYFGH